MIFAQSKKEKSIVIIVYWFGKFPWYYYYFLHSCRYNPTVDFIIISDNQSVTHLPKNVYFIKKSPEEIRQLASKNLEYNVTLEPQPYKFCDFRPAFGVVFQDYIKDYTFWGHGDLDIIFGNIRNFITDEILDKFDVISLRHDYLSSWFALYRNNIKINYLYKQSRDYQRVFANSTYYNFDETNFTFKEFSDGHPYFQITSEIESMTHLIKRLSEENYIKAYFDLHAIEGITGNIEWSKGQLIYKDKYEFILYHLLELKRIFKPKTITKKIPQTFYIDHNKIIF